MALSCGEGLPGRFIAWFPLISPLWDFSIRLLSPGIFEKWKETKQTHEKTA
ncbi:hypothetical protein P378_05250 [Desulforamulus profundi]|uniref:Uncharacterized protein n=1 Tax=Desulforamulus profundi TaxID=1383067 RepID=A0A2C6MHA1_9FIRM|nr:hypothetical protein P378_05250 [Desulforamulus profundi]